MGSAFSHVGKLVWAATWAPDGERFALGGSDKLLHLFESSSGQEEDVLSGHTDDLTFACFCPTGGGQSLVSTADGDPLLVWACPADGRASLERKVAVFDGGSCVGLDWSSDGMLVGAASAAGTLLALQVGPWSVRASWSFDQKAEGNLSGAAWAKDSKRLAAGLGTAVIVASVGVTPSSRAPPDGGSEDTAALPRLYGHAASVVCVAWSPNAEHIMASGDAAGVVRVWDANAAAPLCELHAHEDGERIHSLDWSGWGDARLLSSSADGTLRLWDASSVRAKHGAPAASVAPLGVLRGHSTDVRAGRFAPKGTALTTVFALSSSDDGTARLWDLSRVEGAEAAPGSDVAIQSCTWCARRPGVGAAVIVAGDAKGVVRGFEADGRTCLWQTPLVSLNESSIAVSSVSATADLIACAMWRSVRILRVADGEEVSCLTPPAEWNADWFNSCSLQAVFEGPSAGVVLLGAGGDRAIAALWTLQREATAPGAGSAGSSPTLTWSAAERCGGVEGDVLSMQLHPRAHLVCASTNRGVVLLWSVAAPAAPLRCFEVGAAAADGREWVRHACWMRGGGGGGGDGVGGFDGGADEDCIAAVLGGRGGIVVWRADDASAPPLAQLLECGGAALAWCGATRIANGDSRLVTTGADKCVRVWTVPALEETACFHAAGLFGSSDGIGGEGAFGAEPERALAVGDSSGRLYLLHVRIP